MDGLERICTNFDWTSISASLKFEHYIFLTWHHVQKRSGGMTINNKAKLFNAVIDTMEAEGYLFPASTAEIAGLNTATNLRDLFWLLSPHLKALTGGPKSHQPPP
eukprot:Lithocolla_globosa_v1_NODE_689_length_3433_cov_2.908526.p4 type:complete len:105 gc:universal NODE_689_length_3433_cov_2.908526:3265-2951(-)